MKVIQEKCWVLAGILPKDWISSAFVFPNGRCREALLEGCCWKMKFLEHWCWGATAGIGLLIGSHISVAGVDVPAPHSCSSCRVGGISHGALVLGQAADVPVNLWLLFHSRVMSGIQLLFEIRYFCSRKCKRWMFLVCSGQIQGFGSTANISSF